MTGETAGAVLLGAGALLAALAVIVSTLRRVFRSLRRGARLIDDFWGEPATASTPERAGLMTRVTRIEADLKQHIETGHAPAGPNWRRST